MQNMEDLPKLLPLWHDVTLKDGHVRDIFLSPNTFPDHGGAGIDVFVRDDVVQCQELKLIRNANFGSHSYSLPFLKHNKVDSVVDPCMEHLNLQKKKLKEFGGKLEAGIRSMKGFSKFRKKVISAHEALLVPRKNGTISIPSSVLESAELFPEDLHLPNARWSYTGGCLTTISSAASHLMLHPVGRRLNKLAVTPIQESTEETRYLNAFENQVDHISCGGGHIYQIISSYPSSCCCVRQKKKYHYINFNLLDMESISHSTEKFEFSEEISCLSMSKYVPGENLIAMKNGNLFLQNANKKKIIWLVDKSLKHSSLDNDTWWGCSFGSHPRSVLYNDGFEFSLLDIRCQKSGSVTIFSLPNLFATNDERIRLTKRLDKHNFQHLLATDLHLFVFDERYPQQPLISWRHMLETIPIYCDIQPYEVSSGSTDYVIVLGTQASQDIVQFHLRTECSKIQPLSLSFPLHLSKPTDCVNALKLHCHSVSDQIMKRLSMPLIGLCAVPHSQSLGYTVLQLTSLGDIFYQDFKAKTNEDDKAHRIGPGCVLKPPNEILPQIKHWLEAAYIKAKASTKKFDDAVTLTYVNKNKIIKSTGGPSAVCPMCTPTVSAAEECHKDIVCPTCGLSYSFSSNLIQTYKKLGVLTKDHQDNTENQNDQQFPESLPQLVDLSKMCDPLSKKLLEPWLENSNVVLQSDVQDTQNSFMNSPVSSSHILEASSSQLTETYESTLLNLTMEKSTFFDSQETYLENEDFIPPTQDIVPELYSLAKKSHSRKSTNESVSGF